MESSDSEEEDKKITKSSKLTYNLDYIPKIFSLQNHGNLCYLNSLIQSLLSCPSFNYTMLQKEKKFIEKNNTLALAYIKLYKRNVRKGPQSFLEPVFVESLSPLLNEFIKVREQSKFQYNLSHYRQEDIDEGLTLMIETLGKSIEQLFYVKHENVIYCKKCDEMHTLENGPPEYAINLSESNPFAGNKLVSQVNVEKYIKNSLYIPDDYKCENCGAHNSQNDNIVGVYILKHLSSIIILRFTTKQANIANAQFKTRGTTKQSEINQVYFPQKMQFKSKTGMLNYKIVAQIIQFGSLNGGHYIAKCLRPCENLSDKRAKKIEEQLKNLMKTQSLNPKVKNERIELYKLGLEKELYADTRQKKDGPRMETIIFNDSDVRLEPAGFEPIPNTYLVFYHLDSID